METKVSVVVLDTFPISLFLLYKNAGRRKVNMLTSVSVLGISVSWLATRGK